MKSKAQLTFFTKPSTLQPENDFSVLWIPPTLKVTTTLDCLNFKYFILLLKKSCDLENTCIKLYVYHVIGTYNFLL